MIVKVLMVSSNTNSFGLFGHIMMSEQGHMWQAAANSLNKKKKGDLVDTEQFAKLGFEIPRQYDPPLPPEKAKEIWESH
jgi:hypothetical protein